VEVEEAKWRNLQHLLGQDLAVGGGDGHLWPCGPESLQELLVPLEALGLEEGEAVLQGVLGHGARGGLQAPTFGPIGLGHHQDHLVVAV
jgi:hypothetical protein